MIYYVFLYFSQKGFEGVNIFSQLLSDNELSLDHLSNSKKISIGFFPGASSSLFMFFSAFNLRTKCVKLFDDLKNSPKNLAILMLIIAAVGLAATSVYNPAQAMVSTDNIFSISKESGTGKTLAIMNCLGLGIAYFNFVTMQVFPYSANPSSNPVIEDVIVWLENKKLSVTTIENLKNHFLSGQSSLDTEQALSVDEESIEMINTVSDLSERNLRDAALPDVATIANASILTGLGSMTQLSAPRDTAAAPNRMTVDGVKSLFARGDVNPEAFLPI